MAKRRKKRAYRRTRTKTVVRRRSRGGGGGRRRSRRRRGGGGGAGMLGGILPSKHEMKDIVGAGVYGLLERKAKTDDSFILNKLGAATPLKMIGLAGNVAIAARIVNKFAFRTPLLTHLSNGAAAVAVYQMARQGALFTEAKPFTVSGEYDDDAMAGELDDDAMGALAADADGHELEGDFGDGIEGDEGLDELAGTEQW